MLVGLVAQVDGFHIQFDREFVDGLLQSKGALRMTRSAHRRSRTCINENIAFFGVQRSGLVEIRRGAGTAGAGAASRGAIRDEMDRGDRTILFRSDAQRLIGAGPVADGEMLLLAIEHEPDRRARLI